MNPYKGMAVSDAIQYCNNNQITAADTNARRTGRLDKFAKFTGIPIANLVKELRDGHFNFGQDLVPNKTLGPLSREQKIVIADNYSDTELAQPLALYMNTSYQNIRLAQRNAFTREPTARRKQAYTRALSYDEKVDIFDNYQSYSPVEVADIFKTRYQYAQKALTGDFKRSTDTTTRHSMTLTKEQQDYLGITAEIITWQS